MQYYLNDVPVENVYHVLGTAEWDASSLEALTTAFEDWENTTAKAGRGNSTQLHAVIAVALFELDGPIFLSSVTIDGTNTAILLPNHCTFAVKLSTGRRGRSFRGRSYWIGLTESMNDLDNNQLTPTAVSFIVDAMETLVETAFPNGGQLAVASFQHDCEWRDAAVVTPIIAAEAVDPIIDSQRRRLPGHNVHH